jgi:hypothetical protein
MVRLYGPFIVWDYIRWRRKILRLYYSLIIKGGDAKCCVSFAVEVETQNIASHLRWRWRRKILRLYV